MTAMTVFPAEIWHITCRYLAFDELVALRLTSRETADIAAEFLIPNIRIDTSVESFDRLKAIANHDFLRKGVTKLTYEAALLADAGCVHSYARHYESEHHRGIDKPEAPSGTAKTPRAERLYARNLAKFEQHIEDRYLRYRRQFDAQQLLVKTAAAAGSFFDCIDRLLNLNEVCLRTDGYCAHMVSSQFREKFSKDCAIHLSNDSSPTIWQLEKIVKPGLKRLCARKITPKFFDGQEGRSQAWLNSIFSSLEVVQLMFRQDRESEIADVTSSQPIGSRMLENTLLSSALCSATNLKSLTVNFHAVVERTAGSLMQILAHNSYPNLISLDIDFFSTTEEYFLQILKSQPNLKDVNVAFACVTEGYWHSIIKRMRNDLSLRSFFCSGMLEDPDQMFSTDLCDRELWSDGERLTLGVAIDLYVTDPLYPMGEEDFDKFDDDLDFDDVWNPIYRIEDDFEEEDQLAFEFGSIRDSDEDEDVRSTDKSDNESENDEDDENEDIPTPMSVD